MPISAYYINTNQEKKRTHPESTGKERNHATHVAWFLTLRSDTLVHALAKPDIRLHVPRVKKDLEVGRKLDLQDFDVRRAFPGRFTVRSESREAQASQDTCSLLNVKTTIAE